MTEVRIPKLGVSMEDGSITTWYVSDGQQVTEGELIYSLATDKTENDIESPATGTIRLIGELEVTYPVGEVIAEIS